MSNTDYLTPTGTLTFGEVLNFCYFHFNRRFWILTVLALGLTLLVLLLATLALVSGESGKIGTLILNCSFGLIWALWILIGPYLAARRQYKKQTYLREPFHYVLTDGRMLLTGSNFSSEISWTLVQKVRETQSMFLIYHSAQVAWLLPKRFFSDAAATENCKKFIVARLNKPTLFIPPSFIALLF